MTLVVAVRDLMRKPGHMREIELTHQFEQNFGTEFVFAPKGSEIELDVRLESVHEGILVTATGELEASSECARCLEEVKVPVDVYFQELFHYDSSEEDDFVVGVDEIDLEQALIDAVVPNLPLKPLCSEDCSGLCAGCGMKLAPGEEHEHEAPIDPRFNALKDFGKN